MKRVFVAIGLIVVSLGLNSCHWEWQTYVSITTTHFSLTNEAVRLVKGLETEPQISIVVRYEITDENEEVSNVILANGRLVDGVLKLKHGVSKPTKVSIGVKINADGADAEITAVLAPNGKIDFVLIHRVSPNVNQYWLQIKGKDHRSLDKMLRFSLSGKISSLDGFKPSVLEDGLVYIALRPLRSISQEGTYLWDFRTVLADAGEFSIEQDIDKSTPVRIEIYEGSSGDSRSVERLHAILEPGVNYRVVPMGDNGKFAVQADRDSLHSRLISSWQFDPEFVSLVDQWMESRENRTVSKEVQEEHRKKFVDDYHIAEDCAHVNLTDKVKLEFFSSFPTTFNALGSEIVKRRSATLRQLLSETEDPELARMIFDLSWTLFDDDEIYSDIDVDERIAILLEFAKKTDQAFMEQFIKPELDDYQKGREVVLSNRSLLPGQVAPDFTLTTLAGDEVTFSEILSENEIVLVDFWASTCGPCIRSFPALKKMHSRYKDDGFEIVTISIDYTFEEWETASKKHDLPWIDLGDMEGGESRGWDGKPTVNDYGVMWIPNKFLIDKHGCILHKHFSTHELKEMLSSLGTRTSKLN